MGLAVGLSGLTDQPGPEVRGTGDIICTNRCSNEAVKEAARNIGLTRPANCHTLRHSFATLWKMATISAPFRNSSGIGM
jgi:integrase